MDTTDAGVSIWSRVSICTPPGVHMDTIEGPLCNVALGPRTTTATHHIQE